MIIQLNFGLDWFTLEFRDDPLLILYFQQLYDTLGYTRFTSTGTEIIDSDEEWTDRYELAPNRLEFNLYH